MNDDDDDDDDEGDAMTPEGEASPEGKNRRGRRNFLKTALALAVVLLAGGISAVAKSLVNPQATQTAVSSSGFPRVKVGNVADVNSGGSLTFNYPLKETPNLLVKLGLRGVGGVGPDGDIVAFSQICQHLGCIYGFLGAGTSPTCNTAYKAPGPVGYCCCHGSVFDLANGAKVVAGPSQRPQPQVVLEFDGATGDIYATGMKPPTIFGHTTGSDDVSHDLEGGTPVS